LYGIVSTKQAGVLAAAGLQALSDFDMGLLRADHARAKRLAKALSEITGFKVDVSAVDTNIVIVSLNPEIDPDHLSGLLKERYANYADTNIFMTACVCAYYL
jgi:threonine aldolase